MRSDSLVARSFWLMLFLVLPLGSAVAGESIAVRLELQSAPTLSLQLGEVIESPMRVRVLRQSDDQPVEGVIVTFLADAIICIPLDPNCVEPDPLLYGQFVSAPDDPLSPGQRLTNADGIAVSPDFQAGSLAGSYQIAAGVFSTSGQSFTSLDSVLPTVQVVQGAGGGPGAPAMVPASTWQGQALLAAMLLLLGGLVLRRMQF